MENVVVGPGASQAPASSASSVAQPASARRRHRPTDTIDKTSTDGTGASGSQPERQITDNILVVHEILHTLKTAQGSDQQYMAMKLDMAKAYDRMKWAFLDAMMEKLRFESRFRGWIMECEFQCLDHSRGSIIYFFVPHMCRRI
ncbi:hypothetical protein L3X38_003210 [Prunus dulcis]|uniref:Reverse transcriptase domain-containing protein n=1 Tax=Prunus dulcis TaxID=3755 RepID=A0AAD4ZLM8_PRUDU|nr:hypothetical protein L3X38_003210 [Prunus dulcis]